MQPKYGKYTRHTPTLMNENHKDHSSKLEKEYSLEADIHSYKDPRNERRKKCNTIYNDKNIKSKLACRNEYKFVMIIE